MRKSSLILMLVAAFLLVAAAVSFSAPGKPCDYTCKGWDQPYKIQLGYAGGEQVAASCTTFDYENAFGFCSRRPFPYRWFVMKICDCPAYDASSPRWSTDARYGLKIEIVEPADGVYFADVNRSADATAGACANAPVDACADGTAWNNALVAGVLNNPASGEWFDGVHCPSICDAPTPAMFSYEPVDATKKLYTDGTCNFTDATTAIKTKCDYPLFQGTTGQPWLIFDLPSMVADPAKVQPGTVVKVKITLTNVDDTICPTCIELCSCIKTVGMLGCHAGVEKPDCNLCFPYFPQINGDWWAGVVLTNSGNRVADVTMTFWGGDAAGYKSKQVTVQLAPHSLYIKTLGSLGLDDLAGYPGVYMSLKAKQDDGMGGTKAAQVDGVCIMGDANSGQAYGYKASTGGCGNCGSSCYEGPMNH